MMRKISCSCYFPLFWTEHRMLCVNGGMGNIERSKESQPDREQKQVETGLGDNTAKRIQHAEKTADSLHRIPVTGTKKSQETFAHINANIASVESLQKTPEIKKDFGGENRDDINIMLSEEHFRQLLKRSNALSTSPETKPFVTQFNALFRKYNTRDENDQELSLGERQSILKGMEAILVAWEQKAGRRVSYLPTDVAKAMDLIKNAWYKEKPDLYGKFYNDWITAKTQKEKNTVTLRYAALAERDLGPREPSPEELRELYQRTQRGLEYYLHSRAQLPQATIPNEFIGRERQGSFGTHDMLPQREMALNEFRAEAYSEVRRGLEEIGGQAWVKLLLDGYHTFRETDEQENFLRVIYKDIETLRELRKKIEKKA